LVEIIDLTQEIYNGMPVFPGHLNTVIFPFHTHEGSVGKIHGTKGGFTYTTFGLLMSDHGPTHTDSIWHICNKPGAKKIDEIPLHNFFTSAICLDFTHIKPKGIISVKELEDTLTKTKLDIRKDDTMLLHTGHYNRSYPRPEYLTDNAGLDYDSTAWLAKQGVINIGIDASTIDSCGNTASNFFPAHEVCCEYGIMNTEHLCNLEKVTGKRFTYVGLPLKIRGGTGSPIRAVAILDEQE